jgi:fucose 4-O-acetylase-like acetyltransferase
MKKVHWCHIALIHYEDLEEPLPTPPWMAVFVSPRSIHAPQKNTDSFYSLAYALHVPIIFFLFIFLIYQNIILSLTQHDINKKNQRENTKKPLSTSYIFFACNGILVIAFCF